MAKLSKRAQLEALGWTFTAIPRFHAAGTMWTNSQTGQCNAAYWDHKHPDGWTATPPPGFPASPRRFDNHSPNLAVRWAYEQAMAPRLQPDLGGVAALVALMGEARRAGVVADGVDGGGAPPRPDAELLALCGEVMGAERIADGLRSGSWPFPWEDKAGHQSASSMLGDACRTRDRLLPRVVEVRATTAAGVVAKAQVIELLFDTSRGRRAEAVRALVADLVAVLQADVGAGRVAS